jgi:rare lipoprotein A
VRAFAHAAPLALACALAGCAEPVHQGWAPPPAVAYAPPPPAPSAPGAWTPPPSDAPAYQTGRASYYSDRLAGHRTAAGEPYDPGALTAAHRTLPFGSIVDVSRADGRHVVVRINDRGPFAAGRIIDLSRRAASDLGILRAGVAEVVLRVVWMTPRRARL